jgi:hypothetical protein
MYWINLAQDRNQQWAFVNSVMSRGFHKRWRIPWPAERPSASQGPWSMELMNVVKIATIKKYVLLHNHTLYFYSHKPLQTCCKTLSNRHFKGDYEPIMHNTTFGITLIRQRKRHLPPFIIYFGIL